MFGRRPIGRFAALAAFLVLGTGCEQFLGPTGPDSNWRTYDSAHFALFVRPGSFAEQNAARIAELLEDQYVVTLTSLDLRYAGRVSGFLYNSSADANLMSDHAGVGYPDIETFRAVCVPPLDGNLSMLVSHEANHVIQQAALGRPGTSFVGEGLASAVLSEHHYALGKTYLYAWTSSHASQIPPLASLVDDGKWNDFPLDVAYNASASFLAYLLETSGIQRLRQLYYASSADFARTFQEIYGRPLDEAERAWKDFCAGRSQ